MSNISSFSSFVHSGLGDTFGLHRPYFSELKDLEGEKGGRTFTSILNVAGWIPIIGAIVGAIRIVMGVSAIQEANKDPKNVKKEQDLVGRVFIARGVAEILCLGLLLSIGDIVITVARQVVKPEKETNVKPKEEKV